MSRPQQSAQDAARRLLSFLVDAAHNVVLEADDGHGRFGHLYDPPTMLESLVEVSTTEENVGVPTMSPPVAIHSQEYTCTPYLDLLADSDGGGKPFSVKQWHQVPIMIQNACQDMTIRIRWVDENYHIRPSHTWTLFPKAITETSTNSTSTWVQHCLPGHFFLISIVKTEYGLTTDNANMEEEEDLFSAYENSNYIETNTSKETILGAYRPLRPLPSGKYHTLVIRQVEPNNNDSSDPPEMTSYRQFFLEVPISDPYDALCMAAATLDPQGGQVTDNTTRTIQTLTKIVSNLTRHPQDVKYQKLRLGNPKIQSQLLSSEGAIQFLTLCGFERQRIPVIETAESLTDNKECGGGDEAKVEEKQQNEEEVLMIPQDLIEEERDSLQKTQTQALQLLQILSSRAVSGFVVDLAPPTPWEASQPVFRVRVGNNNQWWAETQDRRRGFLSPDERWERAERVNRNRRNGRRPNPGNAPSSRGNWGR